MSWYQRSLAVIGGVIAENPDLSGEALRKKVAESYPFGARECFPYKAWLKAVNATLGPSSRKLEADRRKNEELLRRLGQGRLDIEESPAS